MMGWWNDLSERERILVGVAGVLAGLLVASLLIVRPLSDWNDAAKRKADRAKDAYELTVAAAAVAGGNSTGSQSSQTPLRQAVIATAGNAGVDLVRIGSVTDARIEIQTAPADADVLFGWFFELEQQHGVTVVFADMSNGDGGQINGQFLVFERRS